MNWKKKKLTEFQEGKLKKIAKWLFIDEENEDFENIKSEIKDKK